MAKTLYLNPFTWDLEIDSSGNIAVASAPYQLAQDAASAIKTFAGEVWYDTTLGIPYFTKILGHSPTLSLIKAQFIAAARTVPGVVAATVYIASMTDRTVRGQVHVTDTAGVTTRAGF